MKSLPKSLSSYLVANSVISKSDDEIVSYGIDLFVSSMAELISIILISAFVGNFKETISFFCYLYLLEYMLEDTTRTQSLDVTSFHLRFMVHLHCHYI